MTSFPQDLMLVSATVDAEVEADWNKWYDEKHLPDILSCPGFEGANRFVSEVDGKRTYIALYKLASPVAMQGKEFNEKRGWEEFAPHVTATVHQFKLIK